MMQFTPSEAKELTTAELEAKYSALTRQMRSGRGCDYETGASMGVVLGELMFKRAKNDGGSGSQMTKYL